MYPCPGGSDHLRAFAGFPEPVTSIIGLGVGAVTYGLVLAAARAGLITLNKVEYALELGLRTARKTMDKSG
ncbi:MAG: hypothetical protein C4315_05620 [Chloroflexota bacterium]